MLLFIAAKMFTTGRIIFSLLFIVTFCTILFFSYKKDALNNKTHYKNGALQVAIILVILILFLAISKYFIK